MTRTSTLNIIVLLGLLLLGGCALSPQEIGADPLLDLAALPKDGGDVTVALSVSDRRAQPVLGRRGGVYDTATVTMAPDLAERLRERIAQGLSMRGYKVAAPGAPGNLTLDVEVAAMTYTVTPGQLTRTVEVATTIKARSRAGDIVRTNEYRDARTKEFVKPPTETENAALVNESIAAALQRMLADPEFLKR
jgi:uncharacterized lipoprotein